MSACGQKLTFKGQKIEPQRRREKSIVIDVNALRHTGMLLAGMTLFL